MTKYHTTKALLLGIPMGSATEPLSMLALALALLAVPSSGTMVITDSPKAFSPINLN
jgi:hypothetical protein